MNFSVPPKPEQVGKSCSRPSKNTGRMDCPTLTKFQEYSFRRLTPRCLTSMKGDWNTSFPSLACRRSRLRWVQVERERSKDTSTNKELSPKLGCSGRARLRFMTPWV